MSKDKTAAKFFADFELKMPTKEESHARSVQWYSTLQGTCLDELPQEVLALSVTTKFYEFDADAFGRAFDGDNSEPKRLAAAMAKDCDWHQRVYKVCTRSPKDTWSNNGVTESSVQGLAWMLYSERILDDVCRLAGLPERTPTIAAREVFVGKNGFGSWEFRCFVKDGNLIAVTDYDYSKPNVVLVSADNRLGIRSRIDAFFHNLHSRMHMQTYVFDVVFDCRDEIILIEINPYGLSDPCFLGTYEAVEAFSGDIAHAAPAKQQTQKDAA